jgi:hypothetical protein
MCRVSCLVEASPTPCCLFLLWWTHVVCPVIHTVPTICLKEILYRQPDFPCLSPCCTSEAHVSVWSTTFQKPKSRSSACCCESERGEFITAYSDELFAQTWNQFQWKCTRSRFSYKLYELYPIRLPSTSIQRLSDISASESSLSCSRAETWMERRAKRRRPKGTGTCCGSRQGQEQEPEESESPALLAAASSSRRAHSASYPRKRRKTPRHQEKHLVTRMIDLLCVCACMGWW